MSFVAILALAIGLAMDSTAVAAAQGMAAGRADARLVLSVAVVFGGVQALAPALGWALGSQLGPSVAAWDHWIAFVLLAGIGGKMAWEARAGAEAPSETPAASPRVLVTLAIATSIDALVVGTTLPMLGAPFVLSIVTIGVVTAVLSGLGVIVGRRFGALLGKRLEMAGGLVLIALGVKILVEHLSV